MKNILTYTMLALMTLASCEDFLEEKSQDQVIPRTARDYSEFVFGEIYPGYQEPKDYYLDLMSDDVKEYIKTYGTDRRLDMYGYYTWQKEPENGLGEEIQFDRAWNDYYHKILMCNVVLEEADNIEGTESEINTIKGECHFFRAYSYFKLVNLYGEPYSKQNANTSLGVPINDEVGMHDKVYPRSSVQEVYNRINSDIDKSLEFLKNSNVNNSVFRISEAAACVLASRIYLYQEDYDKVLQYADRGIALKPSLCNLLEHEGPIMSSDNPEILFTYGQNTTATFWSNYGKGLFAASDKLMSLYSVDDVRTSKYFVTKSGRTKPLKGFHTLLDLYGFALRTSELYLNRAEAYAGKVNVDKAMQDINYLQSHRCAPGTYNENANQNNILKIVREERRRELAFEQQRWFDLRRYGMPSIEHVWTSDLSTGETKTYVLQKNDPAYTLSIPLDVRAINNDIANIERPER